MTVDDEPGRVGDLRRVPIGLAAIVVLAIGSAAGAGQTSVLTVLAAGGFVGSVALLARDRLRNLALGSAVAVASLALLGSILTSGEALVATGALAVGATAAGLVVEGGWRVTLSRALRHSAVGSTLVATIVGLVALVWFVPVVTITDWLVVRGTSNVLDGLLWAIVLSLVSVVALGRALLVLSPVLPPAVEVPTISSIVARLGGERTIWLSVLFAVVVLLRNWFGPVVDAALGALGAPGAVVGWLLTSGVIHVALLTVAVCSLVVLVGSATVTPLRIWLGSYPLRTLSLSTGGIVAVLALSIPVVSTAVDPSRGWAVAATLVVVFAIVEAVASPVSAVVEVDRSRRISLTVGAAAVFVTTVLGAMADVDALLVVGGVVATILLWDLGENALTLREQLGASVDTRQVELVHATASVVVGLAAVGVAVTGVALAGSVSLAIEPRQAAVAITLALGATLVFLVTAQGTVLLRGARRWVRTAGAVLRNPTASVPVRTRTGARSTLLLASATFVGFVLVLVALGHGEFVFWLVLTVVLVVALFAMAGDDPDPIGRRWG